MSRFLSFIRASPFVIRILSHYDTRSTRLNFVYFSPLLFTVHIRSTILVRSCMCTCVRMQGTKVVVIELTLTVRANRSCLDRAQAQTQAPVA